MRNTCVEIIRKKKIKEERTGKDMFCSHCGNQMAEGEKFCPKCGSPVTAGEAPVQNKPIQETTEEKTENKGAEKADSAQNTSVQETTKDKQETKAAAQQTEKSTEGSSDAKKKGKGKLVPLILVLVLLIAGGSGAALYFTSDGYKTGKNEKLAEACVKEEDYKGAIDYYKAVLQLDASREDIYYAAAECYINLDKTDKAIDMLEDGVKACRKDKEAKAGLLAKEAEYYQKLVEEYAAAGKYSEAYAAIEKGYQNTQSEEILAVKADIYQAESDSYKAAGDYERAAAILLKGVEEAGGDALRENLVALYGELVEELLQQSDYAEAQRVLQNGLDNAGDMAGLLREKGAEVYQAKSTEALKAGEIDLGLQILEEGEAALGSEKLTERIEYVMEHIEALPERVAAGISYSDSDTDDTVTLSYLCEYDEENRLVQKLGLNRNGQETGDVITYQYDEAGNVTQMQRTGADGSRTGESYAYEFDGNGNMVKRIIYSEYGEEEATEEYNEKGQIIRITSNDNGYYDGTDENKFEYADAGYLSRWSYVAYSEAGNMIRKAEKRYDERGNIVENINTEYDAYEAYGEPDTVLSWLEEELNYEYDGNRVIKCIATSESQKIDEEINENHAEIYYNYDVNDRVVGYDSYFENYIGASGYGGSGESNYSYNEGIVAVEITDSDYCLGSYQPLTGDMEYIYYGEGYDMYTYDQYGNRIYSVAFGEKTNAQEEKPLSYIYRYTGE